MHRGQPTPSGNALSDFEVEYQAVQDLSDDEFCDHFTHRIVVAGSRGFTDYEKFCDFLTGIIDYKLMGEDGCFVSGCAKGPDAFIIRWCKENQMLCRECPADWDGLGKRAGYVRNAQMASISTEAVIFWDSISKGTGHMYDLCQKGKLQIHMYLFDSAGTEPSTVKERQRSRRELDHRVASEALLEWSPELD